MSDLFYSESDLQKDAYARILITGEPKVGKTTAVLTTAPTPIALLNCDGFGAPMAAKRHGAKNLKILDVTTASLWQKGVLAACEMASKGEVQSIVVDTVTMLINQVLTLDYNRKLQGYDIWRAVLDDGLRYLGKLMNSSAHVFVVSHFQLEDGQLSVNGSLKQQLPATVHDRVHMSYAPKRTPDRAFHIGPDASGLSGGRNSDENKLIPADVRLLLGELGYSTI